jgi:hypothetical protein
MAVLPTPASPTKTGLFFRRRHRMWIVRSSSLERPIIGSMRPAAASALSSTVKATSAFFGAPPRPRAGPASSSSRLAVFGSGSPLRPPPSPRGARVVVVGVVVHLMGRVVHQVELGEALLLHQVDGLAVAQVEIGDQDVRPGHLAALGGLRVEGRDGHDLLERHGGDEIVGLLVRHRRNALVEETLGPALELVRRRPRTAAGPARRRRRRAGRGRGARCRRSRGGGRGRSGGRSRWPPSARA